MIDRATATAAVAATQETGRAQAQATAAAWNATQTMAGALATQAIRREEQRTLMQTGGAVMSFLLKGLAFFGGLFALAGLGRWVGGVIDADLTRRRNAAAYRETPIGAVLLMADPNGGYNYRLIAPPVAPEVVIDAPPPVPERETITRTVMGKPAAPLVADWRDAEDEAVRAELAALLRAAIAVEGEGGTRIPRYAKLPDWQTNAQGWKRLTDKLLLAGHVTKSSGNGGGTFLSGGRTLYGLLVGVLNHSLSLAAVEVVSENVS